jgi:twinkle protein
MKVQKAAWFTKPLLDLYARGLSAGASTGWDCIDRLWTIAPAQVTVVTGIPGHGKSSWVDAVAVNLLTMRHEKPWRFLFCSPEYEPTQLHLAEMLERRLGHRFREGGGRRMTKAQIDHEMNHAEGIGARVEFAEFEDDDDFIDLITVARDFAMRCADGNTQPGVIFDPWNRLEHRRPQHMSETEYISECLSMAVTLTRRTGAHLFIVAHPAKLQADRQTGERPVPTPYDIAGSAHFFNKPDNCITVWRDTKAAQDGRPSETRVYVQKVKFRHLGRIGMASLRYDSVTGRYVDADIPGYPVEYGDDE